MPLQGEVKQWVRFIPCPPQVLAPRNVRVNSSVNVGVRLTVRAGRYSQLLGIPAR